MADPASTTTDGLDQGVSQRSEFARLCAAEAGVELADHAALHAFSVQDVRRFWSLFLRWAGPIVEGDAEPVCTDDDPEQAVFFPALRLNYAENLLRIDEPADAELPAVISRHAARATERLTRGELRERTYALAAALVRLGLEPGDHVVAVVHNDAQAIVAALATSAVGATLSTVAPDLGTPAVLDRFGQLAPKLLLAHLGTSGALVPGSLPERVGEAARALPSLQAIIALDDGEVPGARVPVHRVEALIAAHRAEAEAFRPPRLPFNHPLFVLFTSGTTGPPKCLIHGSGGTLLEHLKEHRLHGDLRSGDRLFFQTSAAWMMWNWQLSALACKTAIVLYDGPVEVDTLWRIAAEERVTTLGTSPSYLQLCQDHGFTPASLGLGSLRTIQSTGSILYDHQYDWVADQVGTQPLQSISGGTDIVGCFVLGNPDLPVSRGEAQCRSLGLDVQAVDEDGTPLIGAVGDLVCRNPFPSRPVGLHGDPEGRRFHEAYFSQHPGMWTHGDLIEFGLEGTARLHGRADGVMNIRGIRVGPADVYRVLREFPEVREALAVEQRVPDRAEQSRMVLLVVPSSPGAVGAAQAIRIRRRIASSLSSAHVPAVIAEVPELPVTHSGKRSEAAARAAVNGIAAANANALRNPGSLEAIAAAVRAARAPRRRSGSSDHEAMVLEIWEDLLGTAGIGREDDFFDLGGDSLLALELAEELRERLGRDVPVARLFSAPTVSGMAATLRRSEAAPQALRPYEPRRRPAWQVRVLERVARLLAAPAVALYRARLVDYETPGELLALLPGRVGMLVRRGWYSSTLESCGIGLFVKPGSIITYPSSRIGDRCSIGSGCHVGWVDMGDHAMIAPRCVILAGNRQHGMSQLDRPMQEQPGTLERVTIGEDVWLGAGTVVMADVAPHTVVTPGSTVDRTFEPYAILTGVPARPTGSRLARQARGSGERGR